MPIGGPGFRIMGTQLRGVRCLQTSDERLERGGRLPWLNDRRFRRA